MFTSMPALNSVDLSFCDLLHIPTVDFSLHPYLQLVLVGNPLCAGPLPSNITPQIDVSYPQPDEIIPHLYLGR